MKTRLTALAAGINDLMAAGVQMVADWKAKTTGVMPKHLQQDVPIDYMGKQAGIKVVALRKLAKLNPNHPLARFQECRDAVGAVTMIQYNRADRPIENPNTDFASDKEVTQRIFDAYK